MTSNNAEDTTATQGGAGRRRSSIGNSSTPTVKKIRPQLIRPRMQQQQQQQQQPKLESHFLKSSLASSDGVNNLNSHDSGSGEDLFADSATTTSELFRQCTKTNNNSKRRATASSSSASSTRMTQFMTSMMRSGSSSRLAAMEEENTDNDNSSSIEYSDEENNCRTDHPDDHTDEKNHGKSGDFISTLHDSKNTNASSLDLTSEVAAVMMAKSGGGGGAGGGAGGDESSKALSISISDFSNYRGRITSPQSSSRRGSRSSMSLSLRQINNGQGSSSNSNINNNLGGSQSSLLFNGDDVGSQYHDDDDNYHSNNNVSDTALSSLSLPQSAATSASSNRQQQEQHSRRTDPKNDPFAFVPSAAASVDSFGLALNVPSSDDGSSCSPSSDGDGGGGGGGHNDNASFSSSVLAAELESLVRQKQEAIDEEEYLRAAEIKDQIERVQKTYQSVNAIVQQIEQLERLKKLAVRQEDFVKAAQLKGQIDELKGRRREQRRSSTATSSTAAAAAAVATSRMERKDLVQSSMDVALDSVSHGRKARSSTTATKLKMTSTRRKSLPSLTTTKQQPKRQESLDNFFERQSDESEDDENLVTQHYQEHQHQQEEQFAEQSIPSSRSRSVPSNQSSRSVEDDDDGDFEFELDSIDSDDPTLRGQRTLSQEDEVDVAPGGRTARRPSRSRQHEKTANASGGTGHSRSTMPEWYVEMVANVSNSNIIPAADEYEAMGASFSSQRRSRRSTRASRTSGNRSPSRSRSKSRAHRDNQRRSRTKGKESSRGRDDDYREDEEDYSRSRRDSKRTGSQTKTTRSRSKSISRRRESRTKYSTMADAQEGTVTVSGQSTTSKHGKSMTVSRASRAAITPQHDPESAILKKKQAKGRSNRRLSIDPQRPAGQNNKKNNRELQTAIHTRLESPSDREFPTGHSTRSLMTAKSHASIRKRLGVTSEFDSPSTSPPAAPYFDSSPTTTVKSFASEGYQTAVQSSTRTKQSSSRQLVNRSHEQEGDAGFDVNAKSSSSNSCRLTRSTVPTSRRCPRSTATTEPSSSLDSMSSSNSNRSPSSGDTVLSQDTIVNTPSKSTRSDRRLVGVSKNDFDLFSSPTGVEYFPPSSSSTSSKNRRRGTGEVGTSLFSSSTSSPSKRKSVVSKVAAATMTAPSLTNKSCADPRVPEKYRKELERVKERSMRSSRRLLSLQDK